jgi:hypothetical protein
MGKRVAGREGQVSGFDDTIEEIINRYPEGEWLARCREAMPDADDGPIMAAIEILCGGDVWEVGEDGVSRPPAPWTG